MYQFNEIRHQCVDNFYFDTKYLNEEFFITELKFDKRHV